jgi:hypothetical protein
MITLKQNLEDKLLFTLLDANMSQKDAHYYSKKIGSEMSDWVRDYFVWFTRAHTKGLKDKETIKAFEFFIQMIKRKEE